MFKFNLHTTKYSPTIGIILIRLLQPPIPKLFFRSRLAKYILLPHNLTDFPHNILLP